MGRVGGREDGEQLDLDSGMEALLAQRYLYEMSAFIDGGPPHVRTRPSSSLRETVLLQACVSLTETDKPAYMSSVLLVHSVFMPLTYSWILPQCMCGQVVSFLCLAFRS